MKNILIILMIVFTLPMILMMTGKKIAKLFIPLKGVIKKLFRLLAIMAVGVGAYLYFTGKINL